MRKLKFVCFTFLILLTGTLAHGQVSISGNSCATGGGTVGYLYTVSGLLEGADLVTWKITGGTILGTSMSTSKGTMDATGGQVRVVWNGSVSAGKVKVSCTRLGEAEIAVQIIQVTNTINLPSSVVNAGSKVSITGNILPASSCNLGNSYWWESSNSADGPFVDLGQGQDRSVAVAATSSKMFYRRVLAVNGDIIYSNVIALVGQ